MTCFKYFFKKQQIIFSGIFFTGVDYKVTLYTNNALDAGTAAEVFGQLSGTTATTATTSFGKTWPDGG
jgi:hypothetical protein